jgi:hypothetical protein
MENRIHALPSVLGGSAIVAAGAKLLFSPIDPQSLPRPSLEGIKAASMDKPKNAAIALQSDFSGH